MSADKKEKQINIDIKKIFSIAVFVIGIIFVLYYIIVKQRVEFDSDYTDTLLWADAMLTGNGLFDKNMFYAYTLPFGGSVLMAPFVAVFGVSYKAHVLGFIIFFIILTFSLYKLMRFMDFDSDSSLFSVGLILLLSLTTKDVRWTMWGHVIHYSLGFLFVIIALAIYSRIDINNFHLLIKKNKSQDEKKTVKSILIYSVFLMILTFLFCSNGLTTILFFFIPFFGAIIIERFINVDEDIFCRENINTLAFSVVCMISGALGFIISKLLQRGVITVYDGIFTRIPAWPEWISDFSDKMRMFLLLTCGQVEDLVAMDSKEGIVILLMALFCFAILLLPFVALFSFKKFTNKTFRLLFISYYILFFASLFIFDFSTAKGTAHRLVGVYITAVTCSICYIVFLLKDKVLSRFGYLASIFMILICVICIGNVNSLKGENRYDKLIKVLKENGLSEGFSDYWSAQITTVLSDSQVEICPVEISEDGNIKARLYNVRPSDYTFKEDTDKYFVFMSNIEHDVTESTIRNKAIGEIPFDEDGYIVVFDKNEMIFN